jgi:hypothetical protein
MVYCFLFGTSEVVTQTEIQTPNLVKDEADIPETTKASNNKLNRITNPKGSPTRHFSAGRQDSGILLLRLIVFTELFYSFYPESSTASSLETAKMINSPRMLLSSCQLRPLHLNNTVNCILTFKFALCFESSLN